MKLRTDFEFTRIDDGEYDFIIENPQYNEETNTISIRARVSGGDSDGGGIPDYYNLTPKDDDKVAFGISKLAALLNVTGIEPDREFKNKDEIYEYYGQLAEKLENERNCNALCKKIDGIVFRGTVKTDKNGKYQNIVKYAPRIATQQPLSSPSQQSEAPEEISW